MATYDARTALLVVDVQNDFADPAGQPLRATAATPIVPRVNARGRPRRATAGALVVYTQDWHPPAHAALRHRTGGSGPCTACRTRGARRSIPTSTGGRPRSSARAHDGRDGYSGFSVRDPESGERRRHGPARDAHASDGDRAARDLRARDRLLRRRDRARRPHARLSRSRCSRDAIRAVDLRARRRRRALARMRDAGAEIV